MRNKKAALLAGILAAAMAENQDPTIMKFGNPYEGLPDLVPCCVSVRERWACALEALHTTLTYEKQLNKYNYEKDRN